jgi:hypothetical protein
MSDDIATSSATFEGTHVEVLAPEVAMNVEPVAVPTKPELGAEEPVPVRAAIEVTTAAAPTVALPILEPGNGLQPTPELLLPEKYDGRQPSLETIVGEGVAEGEFISTPTGEEGPPGSTMSSADQEVPPGKELGDSSMLEAAGSVAARERGALVSTQPSPLEDSTGSIVESNPAFEDDLPDWLKEVALSVELPIERTAPIPQHFDNMEPVQEKRPAPTDEAEGGLTGESTTKAQSFDAESAEPGHPNHSDEAREPATAGVETGAGTSTAEELKGIAQAADHEATQPRTSETQVGELPEAQSAQLEPTESTVGHPTAPASQMPPAQVSRPPVAKETGDFPDWMRELVPPAGVAASGSSKQLRTEPPQLRDDERDELPDWLREKITGEGIATPPSTSADSEVLPLTPRFDRRGWLGGQRISGSILIPGGQLEEVTETVGPLAGVRGVLPLALGTAEPHIIPTAGPTQTDGARVFESVLAAAAKGAEESAPTTSKAAARSPAKWWIYLAVLIAALVPMFVPANLAGLGLKVNNSTPTAGFYDKIQALAPGSSVLIAFDYDAGQAVELDPAARLIVQDLARRHVNVVALSTLPTGVQIADRILQGVSQGDPGWTSGESYVNAGYLAGGEAGLRSLSDNWLPAAQQGAIASTPLGQRTTRLGDFALAMEFAGSEESLRAWMEQVQPRQQVTFVAAVSAAVESAARNYLAANQLAGFLRGIGGAAEYELFSNQTGLNVRTVDAQSFSQLVILGVIVLGNLVFIFERLRKTRSSKI